MRSVRYPRFDDRRSSLHLDPCNQLRLVASVIPNDPTVNEFTLQHRLDLVAWRSILADCWMIEGSWKMRSTCRSYAGITERNCCAGKGRTPCAVANAPKRNEWIVSASSVVSCVYDSDTFPLDLPADVANHLVMSFLNGLPDA